MENVKEVSNIAKYRVGERCVVEYEGKEEIGVIKSCIYNLNGSFIYCVFVGIHCDVYNEDEIWKLKRQKEIEHLQNVNLKDFKPVAPVLSVGDWVVITHKDVITQKEYLIGCVISVLSDNRYFVKVYGLLDKVYEVHISNISRIKFGEL